MLAIVFEALYTINSNPIHRQLAGTLQHNLYSMQPPEFMTGIKQQTRGIKKCLSFVLVLLALLLG